MSPPRSDLAARPAPIDRGEGDHLAAGLANSSHHEQGSCDNRTVTLIICEAQIRCDSGDAAGPPAGVVRRRVDVRHTVDDPQ